MRRLSTHVNNRALRLINDTAKGHTRELKILKYITSLVDFFLFQGKARGRLPPVAKAKATLRGTPPIILDAFYQKFTEATSGTAKKGEDGVMRDGDRYAVSPRLEQKILFHLAILCLMVDHYDVDILDLKNDLNISPRECVARARDVAIETDRLQAGASFQGGRVLHQGAEQAADRDVKVHQGRSVTTQEGSAQDPARVPSSAEKEVSEGRTEVIDQKCVFYVFHSSKQHSVDRRRTVDKSNIREQQDKRQNPCLKKNVTRSSEPQKTNPVQTEQKTTSKSLSRCNVGIDILEQAQQVCIGPKLQSVLQRALGLLQPSHLLQCLCLPPVRLVVPDALKVDADGSVGESFGPALGRHVSLRAVREEDLQLLLEQGGGLPARTGEGHGDGVRVHVDGLLVVSLTEGCVAGSAHLFDCSRALGGDGDGEGGSRRGPT